MADAFEYKVVELRESLVGGNMSGGKLEKILNEHAADGWRLEAITPAKVKVGLGRGAVDSALLTFGRPVAE